MLIGNIEVGRVGLAPMAGFTDSAFRLICRSMGADFCVTEMVSAKALCFSDKKTIVLLTADNPPAIIQLFGSEPDTMARAARLLDCQLQNYNPDIIDINMGCPMNKIVSNGEGSALMKDPLLAGRIIEAVSKAVSVPVTVKLRKGWDDDNINAVEMAKIAQESGASAVTVHGRTRSQMYSGESDCSIIAEVKAALKIPVIGNGDITDAKTALDMFNSTGCDAIMIGRAALGNPFIFSEIQSALSNQEYIRPSVRKRMKIALEHISEAIKAKGEELAVIEARKHLIYYVKGVKGAAKIKQQLCTVKKYYEVEQILDTIDD